MTSTGLLDQHKTEFVKRTLKCGPSSTFKRGGHSFGSNIIDNNSTPFLKMKIMKVLFVVGSALTFSTYSRNNAQIMPKRVKRDLLYQNRMQNNIFRQNVANSRTVNIFSGPSYRSTQPTVKENFSTRKAQAKAKLLERKSWLQTQCRCRFLCKGKSL